MIERIATGLVKAVVSTQRPKKQAQLLSELSFLAVCKAITNVLGDRVLLSPALPAPRAALAR